MLQAASFPLPLVWLFGICSLRAGVWRCSRARKTCTGARVERSFIPKPVNSSSPKHPREELVCAPPGTCSLALGKRLSQFHFLPNETDSLFSSCCSCFPFHTNLPTSGRLYSPPAFFLLHRYSKLALFNLSNQLISSKLPVSLVVLFWAS